MKKDPFQKNILVKAFVLAGLLIISWRLWTSLNLNIEQLRGYLSSFPVVLSGLFFIFLYILTTTLVWIGPKDIFRLSGALLFGAYVSTVFITISEIVCGAIMFSLSRNMGQEYIQQKFHIPSEKLEKVKNRERLFSVFALKINILFPLRLIDLGYGLSKITLGRYLIISLFALPVRIFFQQYILAIVGDSILTDVSSVIETMSQDSFIVMWSGFYILAVLTPTFIAIILKLLKVRNT